MASMRGGFLDSDWMEHYKIYGPGLFNMLGDMYGKLDSGKFDAKAWFSNGDL